MIHADYRAVYRHREVSAAVPAVGVGRVGVHVADRDFISLPVHHISPENKNLPPDAKGGRAQASGNSGHRVAFDPLLRRELQDIHLVGDVVPGFPGTDSHHRIDFNPILKRRDRVAGHGAGHGWNLRLFVRQQENGGQHRKNNNKKENEGGQFFHC